MVLHNICVVERENHTRKWVALLGTTVIDAEGRKRDLELSSWYASHEKVMCRECQARVPQVLYCVHADKISAEDMRLAQANGREHGERLPPIRSRHNATVATRRNQIADKLWHDFMEAHPGFTGQLQEHHLTGSWV